MSQLSKREKFETYAFVTIVTFLVWLYAEAENIKQYDNIPIDVEFVPATDQLIISPTDPQRATVSFDCARGPYERIKAMAKEGPFRLEINDNPSNPDQTIILADRLNDLAEILGLGITINETQPATLSVRAEKLREKDLPVTIVSGELQLQGAATIEPSKVKVLMPASIAQALGDSKAEVRLSSIEDLPRLEVNVPYERQIAVTLPEALRVPNVAVIPDTVKVGFTIKKLTREITIPRVRIVLELPLNLVDQYTVKLAEGQEEVVREMKLLGPNDLIEKIEMNEIEVTAVLKLKPEELEGSITTKLLHINKPEQVQVTSELPQVNFTVTKKAS